MIKLLNRFTIFTIIFCMILNINLIVYADDENIYKIENNNIQSLTHKVNFDKITLNDDNDYFSEVYIAGGLFTSFLLIAPATIASLFIALILGVFASILNLPVNGINPFLSIFILFILSYDYLNSLVVYNTYDDRHQHPFYITFLGSVVGSAVFLLLISLMVVAESLITNNPNSELTKYTWLLYITVLPILVYFSTTLFYKFSKTDNKVAIKEVDVEKMMAEYNSKYKDIVNKIKISKGNVNYTLLKF